MYLVNAMGLLRVSAAGEAYGLDLHEHGISAYPEYVITSMARTAAMSQPEATTVTAPATSRILEEPAH
jgi:Amt family ammonium transporter